MHKTCLRVASGVLSRLVSSMQRLPRLSLLFWDVFFRVKTLYRIMTLFITIETSGMTQALASHAAIIGGMVIDGWEGTRVVSSPLVFQATLALFFLLSFLVEGLIILRTWEMCVQGDWGLMLNLNFLGQLISRTRSSWDLEHGHGNVGGVIISEKY